MLASCLDHPGCLPVEISHSYRKSKDNSPLFLLISNETTESGLN